MGVVQFKKNIPLFFGNLFLYLNCKLLLKLGKNNKHSARKNKNFYVNENGYIVFTEKYHLKRGYCCNNGCLHCPYKPQS